MRTVGGLAALVVASALARSGRLGVGFWIDEGLSVGIADRPLSDIPDALRLDGSPPLYYVLLHAWMSVAGRSEEATHVLSLVLALATIPVAWWIARELYGVRAAWAAAGLFAFAPFLTHYAQETRMYSLVALLGLLACGGFGLAFIQRRPRAAIGFAVALAALLYTHNWAVFATGAFGLAWIVLWRAAPAAERRGLLRAGFVGFGGALLLYAPWLPTLVYQATHTGAPWAQEPSLSSLIGVPAQLVGEYEQFAVVAVAAGGIAGLAAGPRAPRRTALALLGVFAATVLAAWVASQVNPAWAVRYLAVALSPLLLALAPGLANAGRLGLVTLAVASVLWVAGGAPDDKSNVRDVAEAVEPALRPGDVVVSTQPEQVPVLRYYLGDRLRYATLWGSLSETGVTDWRDGVHRLRATSAEEHLAPLIAGLEPGRRLVLVEPMVYDLERWSAPWTSLVRVRSTQWRAHAANHPELRAIAAYPPRSEPQRPNPVRATVFVRERMG